MKRSKSYRQRIVWSLSLLKKYGGEGEVLSFGLHQSDRTIAPLLIRSWETLFRRSFYLLLKEQVIRWFGDMFAGEISSEQLRSHIDEVFTSLGKLHKAEFAHHDIKPENLLLNKGRLDLADFGLVIKYNKQNVDRGTPWFLPPENVNKQHLDGRVKDLYAMALTMFSLRSKEESILIEKIKEIGNSLQINN